MSDSSRTDALIEAHEKLDKSFNYRWHDYVDLARQLERELAAMTKRAEEAERQVEKRGKEIRRCLDQIEGWNKAVVYARQMPSLEDIPIEVVSQMSRPAMLTEIVRLRAAIDAARGKNG